MISSLHQNSYQNNDSDALAMKVIIVGATGLVGTELIRQSLVHPSITSVIAVTRRTLAPPSPSPKFKNILVKDYDQYATDAKSAFKGANACIWTIAITPSKSSIYPWEEVVRICQTSTMNGLRAMHDAGTAKPFRFIYMSGVAAERDQTKTPSFKPQYSLMRVCLACSSALPECYSQIVLSKYFTTLHPASC